MVGREPRHLAQGELRTAHSSPSPASSAWCSRRTAGAMRWCCCNHLETPAHQRSGQTTVSTTTRALARYLVSDFVSNFGAYKGLAGLASLVYRRLDSVEASGDPASTYSETVTSRRSDTVRLTWSGLGEPFCFALPPDKSATGKHHMPSLFVGCDDATSDRERAHSSGQARSARDCRPHHHDGDAGLLGDLDPHGLTVLSSRSCKPSRARR